MFYIVSYEKNKANKMNSFKTRALANDFYNKMPNDIARVLISGETGDVLQGKGDQN